MLIYRLTFASGKVYIGQTVKTMEQRYAKHQADAGRGSLLPVHAAWRKHGAPSFEVIGTYYDIDALNAAEIAAISSHDCLSPRGYNLSLGGMNGGQKHPETRAKIGAAHTGRIQTDEARANVGNAVRRNWQNPEYREKVLAGVAASFTPERRASLAEHAKRIHTGKVVSDETREKLRNRAISDEQRARMSAAAKARKRGPRSEETCAKMAESAKRYWANPDNSLNRSISIKAAHAARSPEERSDAARKAWETKRAKEKDHGD